MPSSPTNTEQYQAKEVKQVTSTPVQYPAIETKPVTSQSIEFYQAKEVKPIYSEPVQEYVAKPISVVFNGNLLNFDDQAPVMLNGRVMVPMRKIFEALGASVGWDGPTQTVAGIKKGKIVVLRIGVLKALVNDQQVSVDPPPQLINGRTYVPLRFVSESLGANVGWDGVNQKVTITSTTEPTTEQLASNDDQTVSNDNNQDLSFFFKEWKLNVGGGTTIIPGVSYDTQITSAGTGTVGTLVIRSDGTYTWNTSSGVINGDWKATGEGTEVGSHPIILLNGELGRDYKVGRGDGTTQGRETNISVGDLKGLRWTIGKPAN
ncbi:hypothetical protein GJ688_05115 [Heliobacillus mobilis]|uniref:Copper amine oxidase-like N-terminal domain-containing protein n=2 Tax=Heliobacterium mobile TaxID=28064 RepID=A0A6I3SHP0_HELMO|nr:hypothetical protein [Heliobacterium mobile]